LKSRSSEIKPTGAEIIIEDVAAILGHRFGRPQRLGNARIITFGNALTCSVNYSKLLHGNKYFFGLPPGILTSTSGLPETKFGAFVLLICGSADKVLVLPRPFMLEMMEGVSSRRVDIFLEDGSYVLQTTKHPKCNVTEYLNAFPVDEHAPTQEGDPNLAEPSRIHVKVQFSLIMLGRAEGCAVWVPTNDRNLSHERRPFSAHTVTKLPNFGFEENTRRIIQNIDVLWLSGNVIQKAFEIESTTSIYSGLLRLNDLVLAQPNIRIDLFIAAARTKRERVYMQLLRPSLQPLLPKCAFLSFEEIEKQMKHLEALPLDAGTRVSGLIRGEKFKIPEHFLYPSGL
jgi:hypothetical protein